MDPTLHALDKLSNHGGVSISTHGLHGSLGTGFGDHPQIIRGLVLSYTNARIQHREVFVDALDTTGDLDSTRQVGHDRLGQTRPAVRNMLVNGLCPIILTVLVAPKKKTAEYSEVSESPFHTNPLDSTSS